MAVRSEIISMGGSLLEPGGFGRHARQTLTVTRAEGSPRLDLRRDYPVRRCIPPDPPAPSKLPGLEEVCASRGLSGPNIRMMEKVY